ncbi:MAG: hypothetical protein ACOYOD_10470, partial [Saprospiraceae bacterium]
APEIPPLCAFAPLRDLFFARKAAKTQRKMPLLTPAAHRLNRDFQDERMSKGIFNPLVSPLPTSLIVWHLRKQTAKWYILVFVLKFYFILNNIYKFYFYKKSIL